MAEKITETCRTCLDTNGELISIYNGDDKSVVEKLEYILDTRVDVTNLLPQQVCHDCFNEIGRCYAFKTKCKSSFQILSYLFEKRNISTPVKELKEEQEIDISDEFQETEYEAQKTMDEIQQGSLSVQMEEISIKTELVECQNETLGQQLVESKTQQHLSHTTINSNCNQIESVSHESNHNINEVHTVQYLITELEDEKDPVDQLLEVKANIRQCGSCGTGFARVADFNKHKNKCNRERGPLLFQTGGARGKKHYCSYCAKVFPRPCRLNNHLLKHHSQIISGKQKEALQINNKFDCPHCDRSFFTESILKQHMKMHSKEENKKTKLSTNDLALKSHLKKHECELCHQKFDFSSQLSMHMFDHKNYKYFCKFCPEKFSFEKDFKMHNIRIHNDKKPFKCKFCGMGFSEILNLVYHNIKCRATYAV